MSDIDKADVYDGEPWSEMDLWEKKRKDRIGEVAALPSSRR
jgi:hypothetical protein